MAMFGKAPSLLTKDKANSGPNLKGEVERMPRHPSSHPERFDPNRLRKERRAMRDRSRAR